MRPCHCVPPLRPELPLVPPLSASRQQPSCSYTTMPAAAVTTECVLPGSPRNTHSFRGNSNVLRSDSRPAERVDAQASTVTRAYSVHTRLRAGREVVRLLDRRLKRLF